MSSVNKVILIGKVENDPDVRYIDRGVCIARFNLITTEKGYTTANGTEVSDREQSLPIVLLRNLGEWAEQYVRQGNRLYVEGKLQTRTWEKNGQTWSKLEILAEHVQIL